MSLLNTLPLEIETIILDLKKDMDEVELNFKHYYIGRFNRVLKQLKQVHHSCTECNKCWELDELYYCDVKLFFVQRPTGTRSPTFYLSYS